MNAVTNQTILTSTVASSVKENNTETSMYSVNQLPVYGGMTQTTQ